MTPFQTLSAACNGADEIILAAPYIRSSAMRRLPLASVGKLSVYLRGAAADFVSGASDLQLLQYVASLGGNLYICPILHAKYYRADHIILVGSANLSDRGLGLAAQLSNLEILTPPSPSFDWKTFETDLNHKSILVSENLQTTIRRNIDIVSRTGLAVPSPDQLAGWTPQAALPAYVWDGYSGKINSVPLSVQRDAVFRDLAALDLPEGLSEIAFYAWLRAILLTAPSTSPVIIARLANADISFSNESSPQLALSWWEQLTVAHIP